MCVCVCVGGGGEGKVLSAQLRMYASTVLVVLVV